MRIRKAAAMAAAAGIGLVAFNPAPAQADPAADGSVRIVNVAESANGPQAIDASHYGTVDNTPVLAYSIKSTDQANQRWYIEEAAGGTVTIRGKQSRDAGAEMCVTPTGSNGAVVLLACAPEENAAQKWHKSGTPQRHTYENAAYDGELLSFEGFKKQLAIRDLTAGDDTQVWKTMR